MRDGWSDEMFEGYYDSIESMEDEHGDYVPDFDTEEAYLAVVERDFLNYQAGLRFPETDCE